MRLIVDKNESFRDVKLAELRRAINYVAANVALKAVLKRDGELFLKIDGARYIFIASKHEDSADISEDADGIFKIRLPTYERWSKATACTVLDILDIPYWIELMIGKSEDGGPPAWVLDLAEHKMRVDLLAGILKSTVEELEEKTIILESGRCIPAILDPRNSEDKHKGSRLVDVRVVLAALALEHRRPAANDTRYAI